MQLKNIAAGIAALALPLTALGAAPAFAGDRPDKHETPGPSIEIKDVHAKVIKKVVVIKKHGHKKKVVKFEYPDPVVKVKYQCYTEQDKKKHGEEVENGTIKAVLEQKKAKRWGEAEAICDGEKRKTEVVLEDGYGNLKKGHAWVAVKITDPQDESAYDKDKAEVKLIVKKVIKH